MIRLNDSRICKKSHTFFIFASLIIVGSFLSFSCSSENDQKKSSYSKNEATDIIKKSIKENIRYKISLICLKYNTSNEQFVDEMVQVIAKKDLLYNFDTYSEEQKKDMVSIESLLIKKYDHFDKNELAQISQKFNVSISTIASIIYDYELWEAALSSSE